MEEQRNREFILNRIKNISVHRKSVLSADTVKIKRKKSFSDVVHEFQERARNVGAEVWRAKNADEAGEIAINIIKRSGAKSVILEDKLSVDESKIRKNLKRIELTIINRDDELIQDRSELFDRVNRAEAGITGTDFGVSDSGSIVLKSSSARPRSLSLLPPIHIALLKENKILPSLYELMVMIEQESIDDSAITIITGPSKTADIEFNLVKGIHGPGELHIIIIP